MPTVEYNETTKTSDFIDGIRIIEIKGVDYIFTFYNGFTGNAYVFKLYKEVFDTMMKERRIIDLKVDIIDPKKELEELEKEVQGMVT